MTQGGFLVSFSYLDQLSLQVISQITRYITNIRNYIAAGKTNNVILESTKMNINTSFGFFLNLNIIDKKRFRKCYKLMEQSFRIVSITLPSLNSYIHHYLSMFDSNFMKKICKKLNIFIKMTKSIDKTHMQAQDINKSNFNPFLSISNLQSLLRRI